MTVRKIVEDHMHRLGGIDLTPEEYLYATRYLASRCRWPADHEWTLTPASSPPTVGTTPTQEGRP